MLLVRAALAAAVLACVSAAPALAQDPQPTPTPTPAPSPSPTPAPTPAPEPRIAQGVSAGGVDLSNLTVDEATLRLQQILTLPLKADIVIAVAGKRWTLKVRKAKFAFDANRTARRAYQAGVKDPPAVPAGGGAVAAVDVPLAVTFRRAPVRDFVDAIDRAVYIAPRDARLRITLRKMIRRRSHEGRDLDNLGVRAMIEEALADARKPRLIAPGRLAVKPKVNALELPRVHPTVITIDRAHFKLRVFKRLKLSKTYGIAVGQPGYPTPTGSFHIQDKQVNPTWTAPNSPWAGELAGQSISGGAWNNPLKARWMGIANGVGIHGTGMEWSIGSRASHGCIRMRVADVIDLYPRVPVGAPVLIR